MDEIATMDGNKCILQLRGIRPFLSDKYDLTKHPWYKYLSDADPKNAFHIESCLSTHMEPKEHELFMTFELDAEEKPEDYGENEDEPFDIGAFG